MLRIQATQSVKARPVHRWLLQHTLIGNQAAADPVHRLQIVHMETPHSVNVKVPELDVNYHHTLQEQGWRGGLKPLNVVQPQGPSWQVAAWPGGSKEGLACGSL